jgi:tetratricopeptide (TPR) repeat protein
VGAVFLHACALQPILYAQADESAVAVLSDAQHLFYSGRYEDAAAVVLALRTSDPDDLEGYELRTSALHFQIRRALGDTPNRRKALAQCAICAALMADFFRDTADGQRRGRARLQTNPQDEAALFFLGKIDLNYVWLQLGTLGRKTGWNEYWEARRSLDAVLKGNPAHVRARVARAWIDYIVDTKMPRGTKWLLGGGNKRQGLLVVRQAANAEADFFIQAEAGFALWDMQVREGDIADAIATARRLASDFPDNRDLIRFLDTHQSPSATRNRQP